ncbi:MAG: hypothetical protein A3F10_05500 [Coxiella sp. RIFCSPHIGHO2_12_FULL_42_15]|nr:MAG: hypothetical protein A3F10_05500 [Coxiella sp. RIFCSPHIGHO2_12_FULL_42_15]
MLPRLIRMRDAPKYLGMDRHRFNQDVRPSLIEIPIGKQGIAFDLLDLNAWADEYKSRSGRSKTIRRTLWAAKEHQVSTKEKGSGTLINKSSGNAFAKALEQLL